MESFLAERGQARVSARVRRCEKWGFGDDKACPEPVEGSGRRKGYQLGKM
jgi:hypothetical protein